jgi:hypothetical protein
LGQESIAQLKEPVILGWPALSFFIAKGIDMRRRFASGGLVLVCLAVLAMSGCGGQGKKGENQGYDRPPLKKIEKQ